MTNKEASEWFKKRAQEAPMPGAREAFKLAAEALANADVPDKNVGDTINRQDAIDACGGYLVPSQIIANLPPAQPEQHIDADGTLWITVINIEQVKRVIVDEEKSKFCRQFYMDAQPEQPKKTLYKHFKGGIYELIAPRAMNTEGNEIYTIYRSVKNGTVWVRPYGMFFGDVVNDKGEIVPRFVLYQPQEEQQEGEAE